MIRITPRHILFAFLGGAALCLYACPARAGYDTINPNIEIRRAAPSCMDGVEQPVAMTLSGKDHERLQLASAYIKHLESQGQDSAVIKSLYRASLKTGVDFDLLLMKALLESDLGRFNVAARSTARGVFQYIEPTWLILINRYGDKIGHPEYANAIKISRREGFPYFDGNDKYLKEEILAMRHDNDMSAMIKAYQIIEETDVIKGYKNGGTVTATDHYIAHMLGLKLAKDLYSMKARGSVFVLARLDNPQMREAAMLNKQFFYDRKKTPLAANAVYEQFEKRVGREMKRIRDVVRYTYAPACRYAVQDMPDFKTIR
jgi:hypothetical protein